MRAHVFVLFTFVSVTSVNKNRTEQASSWVISPAPTRSRSPASTRSLSPSSRLQIRKPRLHEVSQAEGHKAPPPLGLLG